MTSTTHKTLGYASLLISLITTAVMGYLCGMPLLYILTTLSNRSDAATASSGTLAGENMLINLGVQTLFPRVLIMVPIIAVLFGIGVWQLRAAQEKLDWSFWAVICICIIVVAFLGGMASIYLSGR